MTRAGAPPAVMYPEFEKMHQMGPWFWKNGVHIAKYGPINTVTNGQSFKSHLQDWL